MNHTRQLIHEHSDQATTYDVVPVRRHGLETSENDLLDNGRWFARGDPL